MPGASLAPPAPLLAPRNRLTHAFSSDKVNKMLVGNKCDLTTKKVVDYTTAKVRCRCSRALSCLLQPSVVQG